MKQLIHWLEHSFAPKMNKINNNVWVTTLKDSIMQVLPFILLGSIFCFLTVPGDVFGWQWWPNFWTPFGWTMGLLSLFVAFLIPFNLMEKKRLRKQRIIAALSGVVAFLIIISPQVIKDGVPGFGHASLGAGGMFVAITAGVFSGLIMGLFGKFSFFKETSVIPDFVRAWFDSMLPAGIIVCSLWVLVDLLGIDIYNIVLSLFMPISNVMQTPWGFALSLLLVCFLYSLGISSWVLTPVYKPAMLMAITANVSMAAAGTATHETLNLVTDPTVYSAYIWIGGIGCIAWNPIMMIPMWLMGIILPTVVWIFTKVIPFAPIPTRVFDMWYCPFPISTWLTTGSIKGIILMAVCALLSTVIWYPFFRIYDSQEAEAERKAEEKK